LQSLNKSKYNKKYEVWGSDPAPPAPTEAAAQPAGLFFFHLDHLGTPQMMTDENGEVVWQADYLPFGEVNVNVVAVENQFRLPGQYYDQETELHYNYHRYYDPTLRNCRTGCFITYKIDAYPIQIKWVLRYRICMAFYRGEKVYHNTE